MRNEATAWAMAWAAAELRPPTMVSRGHTEIGDLSPHDLDPLLQVSVFDLLPRFFSTRAARHLCVFSLLDEPVFLQLLLSTLMSTLKTFAFSFRIGCVRKILVVGRKTRSKFRK